MSPARLARFRRAANQDKHLALRLYVWNASICEALYFPMQVAEVTARNAISIPVRKRFGDEWYANSKFLNLLPSRYKETLDSTVTKERKKRRGTLNQDHVVAGLPFGFWVNLMTSSYDNHLWVNGVAGSFPNCGNRKREDIHKMLDKLRNFRNEIAHHFAVFDRLPQAQYQNALAITEIACLETHWMMTEISRVSHVINQRPKI
jgi:hypothetical protein